MTVYKVRRGEVVVDVEGFAALVEMAQAGELGPDDAVFVPASNRWHYARSIRQLREHFPAVEDPPPPEGKVREMPRDAPPPAAPPTRPGFDATEATKVQDEGTGGDVVPMRRGRWTPEGKGVEVSVFNYEVDLETSKGVKPLRLVGIVLFALTVGGAIYLYNTSYAAYQEKEGERLAGGLVGTSAPTPDVTPRAGSSADVSDTDVLATAVTPVPAATTSSAVAVAATPVPLPVFDTDGALAKVHAAGVTNVQRPDQLATAIRGDLIKLAVPVRAVVLVPGKAGKTKGPVPFDLVVDYSLGDDSTTTTHAKHYWMIAAMIGRRANELSLNLRQVSVRSFQGNKVGSTAVLPAELVRGVANGSTGSDALLRQFPDLTR